MASAARTLHACLTHAQEQLLAAAFHEGPVFRMGFDSHVKAWDKYVQRETFVTYHKVGHFAQLYDRKRNLIRAMAERELGNFKGEIS